MTTFLKLSRPFKLKLSKKIPPKTSLSTLSTQSSADVIGIPDEDDPIIQWLGSLKIDPCYINSKSPLKSPQISERDLLSELDWFDDKEVCPYNTDDWEKFVSSPDQFQIDQDRIAASVYSGLPANLRGKIWLILAQIDELKKEHIERGFNYKEQCEVACEDEHLIGKDLARSFKKISFFMENDQQKIQIVYRILMAYANFDKEVGYTQGLNFLSGMLLFLLHTEKVIENGTEEEYEELAFWMLVSVMQIKNWRMLFIDQTPKLMEVMDEIELTLESKLPRLYKHISQTIPNCAVACFPQYCMTLLIFNTPFDFAKRCLEFFLISGKEVIMHILVKLLTICQDDLLQLSSIGELIQFMKFDLVTNAIAKYPNYFKRFLAHHQRF